MVLHPETGLDPPIGSDQESGCDMNSYDKEETTLGKEESRSLMFKSASLYKSTIIGLLE